MAKYRTLDQHVRLHGEYIPPYTEVEVTEGDMAVWDELCALKVAEKVEGKKKKKEEPPPKKTTPKK